MIKILVLCFLFSGCVTQYQRNGYTGGFSDIKLNADLFEVTFNGNGYTGASTVKRYFLRRCAEVTLENGFDYFVFVDQEAYAGKYGGGSTERGTITKDFAGNYEYRGTIEQSSVTKHGRTGTIKAFVKGKQPETSYDAQEILNSFGQ